MLQHKCVSTLKLLYLSLWSLLHTFWELLDDDLEWVSSYHIIYNAGHHAFCMTILKCKEQKVCLINVAITSSAFVISEIFLGWMVFIKPSYLYCIGQRGGEPSDVPTKVITTLKSIICIKFGVSLPPNVLYTAYIRLYSVIALITSPFRTAPSRWLRWLTILSSLGWEAFSCKKCCPRNLQDLEYFQAILVFNQCGVAILPHCIILSRR